MLGFTTFLLGFYSLCQEILCIRALAPFIGASLPATSVSIAMAVLGLSTGYYFSFLAGDSSKSGKTLFQALTVAGGLILFSPTFLVALSELLFLQKNGNSIILSNLVFHFLGPLYLVGLPSVSLGFCSPIILEKMTEEKINIRKTIARYFIIGGIGSLLGALLPHFFFIPYLGTRLSFIILGSLLSIVGFYGQKRFGKISHELCVIFLSVFSSSLLALSQHEPDLLLKTETSYQTIYVEKGVHHHPRLLFDRRVGVQSVYPSDALIKNPYFAVSLLPLQSNIVKKNPYEMLVLGSAGCTVGTLAKKVYGSEFPLSIANVDIDPKVHEIAHQYFDAPLEGIRYISSDARVFVRKKDRIYNYIYLDSYTKEKIIPNQLATVEFFKEIDAILAAEGILFANIVAESEKAIVFRSIVGSIQTFFPYTYLYSTGSNKFIFASRSPIEWEKLVNAEKQSDLELNSTYQKLLPKITPLEKENLYAKDDSFSSEWPVENRRE